jgi:hypothetical protein
MSGAYCRYCDHRCFVLRRLPADARGPHAGTTIHLATCARGMEHDRSVTGYDVDTAINPARHASTSSPSTSMVDVPARQGHRMSEPRWRIVSRGPESVLPAECATCGHWLSTVAWCDTHQPHRPLVCGVCRSEAAS